MNHRTVIGLILVVAMLVACGQDRPTVDSPPPATVKVALEVSPSPTEVEQATQEHASQETDQFEAIYAQHTSH